MNPYSTIMERIRYRVLPGRLAPTEVAVQNFERVIGHNLPSDYREFLLDYGLTAGNGATRFTPHDDPDEASSVDVFYGLTPGHSYDLEVNRATFTDQFPSHLIPIGCGSGGQFLLSLAGANVGAMYWWFQESGIVQSEDDLEHIADNFSQFMASLTCDES